MLKSVLVKSCLSLATAFGVAASYGHIGSYFIGSNAPSPLQFTKSQGLKLSPEGEDVLRSFSDVRIIECGSSNEKQYKYFNPLSYYFSFKDADCAAFTFYPSSLAKVFGNRPVIFMPPYLKGLALKNFQAAYDGITPEVSYDKQDFTHALFHELGHIDFVERHGIKTSSVLQERYADLYSRPHVERELGNDGVKYVFALRSFNILPEKYDTIPALLYRKTPQDLVERPISDNTKGYTKKHFDMAANCIISVDKLLNLSPERRTAAIGLNHMDRLYQCYKNHEQPLREGANFAEYNEYARAVDFMDAYRYFFPKKSHLTLD